MLQALRNFAALFRKLEADLHGRGAYFRANCGRFNAGLENIDFVERVGQPRSRREILEKTEQLFNQVRRCALALLEEEDAPARLPLQDFMSDRPL